MANSAARALLSGVLFLRVLRAKLDRNPKKDRLKATNRKNEPRQHLGLNHNLRVSTGLHRIVYPVQTKTKQHETQSNGNA